ncbi:MAG TPA: signal peptide peptidase SppA [Bryobacteraceae bacterium]|nr:signal peptide peptidase SppA [Bryobacteraceae bacterium]
MKKFLLGILVGFVFLGLASVVVLFAFVRLATRPPGIPDDSVLVLKIEGDIPERPPVSIPVPFLDGPPRATVRDYWEMLRKAAADPRIRAVIVAPDGVAAGWGKCEELRSNLEAFKRSGKPLYAWLSYPRTRDYYVASAADKIFMAPEDALDMKGLRFELMYLKAGLDKIGVQVEMEHAGKYKDAPEMFTRTEPSPESRESLNAVLDEVYSQLVSVIGKARKKSPEEVRALLDQGPFLSGQAKAAGLVDSLEYQDGMFNQLKSRLKEKELHKLAHTDYLNVSSESAGLRPKSRIALVAAEGSIVRSGGDSPFGDSGMLTAAEMRTLLRRAADDRAIRGIIVRVDSPGGDSFASDEIWREMSLASKKKPLVVSMSDTAASGGYYLAMTGDPVLAYPGTVTGSIGVFYGKVNLRGLYNKLGVSKEILARGQFAALDSDYAPLTDAGRQKLQTMVQATYSTFLSRVAHGRKRPVNEVEGLAQGRVWIGSAARRNGLIDELGGIDRAVEIVKQKSGIPKDELVRLVSYPPRQTIFERMMAKRDPLANVNESLSGIIGPLRRLSTTGWARGAVFTAMPFTIEMR